MSLLPRILLVEDDLIHALVLREVLGRQFQVEHHNQADESLLPYLQDPPHLVITDINLGGQGSGFEVLRLVRSLAGTVPVIALTGYSLDSHPDLANFDLVVSKPVDFEQLCQVCQNLALTSARPV